MPAGFGTPICQEFRYITVDDLRADGFTEEELPTPRANDLIVLASNWVNTLTQQWFLPVRLQQKVDGRSAAMAHHPLHLPILELFNLRLGRSDLFILDMPAIAYSVKPRYVQMMYHKGYLPSNPLFVILDGVFGWLENDFAPVRTTTTDPVVLGATVIKVASSTGITAGEVVLVGNDVAPASGAMIVKAVNSNDLTVEAAQFTCPAGVAVVKYGRVPRLIQWAVKLMVKDKITPVGMRGKDGDPDCPPWFCRRVTNESVEGYSYGLAQLPAQYGFGGGTWTTGNPEVDDILQQYAQPVVYVGNTG